MTPLPNIRPITPAEIKAYEEDGVVCLRQLFSPEWVAALRTAAEASLAKPGDLHAELATLRQEKGRFFHDTFVWRRNETCRDFVFNSPAGTLAASVLQSEKINIFFDQWLIKEPGTITKTPWHHDMTYWPINGWQIATLWLALDSVTAETGAVEYVKGSHKWGQKFKPASFSGNNQYTENLPKVPDIESMRDKFEHISRWAGDDVVFHPRAGLQEMPPFPPELNSGDPLDSELWPRIIG